MRELGCRFALDDFGTGMSSFAYLKNLPVDFLKIDGSFVRDMLDDPVDCGMVESINQIGHLMGLKTIAEYVESDSVRERLIEIGVDYVQGFGVSTPEPLV
jgi:EAL domain-containing protein (putative c-di-GMP-specific phosphodiesterase class I)